MPKFSINPVERDKLAEDIRNIGSSFSPLTVATPQGDSHKSDINPPGSEEVPGVPEAIHSQ